jgi:hexosaminidase
MKKIVILCLLLLSVAGVQAQSSLSALIPRPNEVKLVHGKSFSLNQSTPIYINDESLSFCASSLQQIIADRMAIQVNLSEAKPSQPCISLLLDKSVNGNEHYILDIKKNGITISGSTPAAILYGVFSLDKILLGDYMATEKKQISAIHIDDQPRFGRRALMLDPARGFLPIKDIKFYMDQMMKFKFNVLQLHLTDDEGWRIEIKGEPKLTETGPFYTQEEMRDLIDYGSKRNIEIVPELDIPGHTAAFLAAYPHLGCTSTDTIQKIPGKTKNIMVCASLDEVYTHYKTIIEQVCDLFPSPYIHLGGDESVIERNWAKCERCQALMQEKGYTKASQLMIPFFDKILGFVRQKGKKAILWCELDNFRLPANDFLFPYPKDVTLVSWRGGLTPKCIELATKNGNDIILAPGEYAYLDYPQMKGDLPEFNNWGMPVTTLKQSQEFDPGYGESFKNPEHVIGIMGTVWGEAVKNINRACYMTYPRAFALSEAAWSWLSGPKEWKSFKARLYPNVDDLMKHGVAVRAPFEIANE